MSASPSSLKNKEILIGVCGGVAAYKTADLVSKLRQVGAQVSVVMTEAAGAFIGKTTFEALTNRPVYSELFSPREHFLGEHIGLARRAEAFVIAPATANGISSSFKALVSRIIAWWIGDWPIKNCPARSATIEIGFGIAFYRQTEYEQTKPSLSHFVF